MTKEELEKATGQELIDARNYCGVDGYYGAYLDEVNAEMLKRFNRLAELENGNKVLEQNLEDTEILNKTYEKRFNDLEKENAELKLKLEALEGQTPWKDIKDKSEVIGQLTKAKEIIKGLLPMASNFVFGTLPKLDEEVQLYKQAEQFLDSEVEK